MSTWKTIAYLVLFLVCSRTCYKIPFVINTNTFQYWKLIGCFLFKTFEGRDASCRLKLDWCTRQKICIGVAKGLAYLHEESRIKIVHRDIKTSNVLLDKDLNAKISDFGLAKLNEDDNTHISTRIAGTM